MRNVKRPSLPPKSLIDNSCKWTKTLLKKIEESKKRGEKTTDFYYNHYNKDDIKKALLKIYKGYCCYCESRVDDIIDESEDDRKKKYGHIEHLKPKKKYPEYCYDWDNLHLACSDCNITKRDKYDNKFPILDPTKDNPIEDNYIFELEGIGLHFKPLTKRAETTENHTSLNRNNLLKNRLEVFLHIYNLYLKWKNMKNNVEKAAKIRQLKTLAKEEQYGSVIKWVLQDLFN